MFGMAAMRIARVAAMLWAFGAASGALLPGCRGEIGALTDSEGTPSPPAPGAGSTTGYVPGGGGRGTGGAPGGFTDGGPGAISACTGTPTAGEAPLRRLTRAEYARAVRDVFHVTVDANAALSPDERVGGVFASNVEGRVAALQTRQFLDAAEDVTTRMDVDALSRCDRPAAAGAAAGDEACAVQFIAETGRLAYRRPLDGEEKAAYLGVYRDLRAAGDDHPTAIRVVAQAFLQSPHFIYHLELTDPSAPAVGKSIARLPGFVLASRLSFLLWGSVPDDTLLDQAARGALDDDDGLAAEAARLFEDDRARDAIAEFHSDWLGLPRLDTATRDPLQFPEYGPELMTAMRDDVAAFTDYVVRQQGEGLSLLLTAPLSFAKGPAVALLAPGEGTSKDGHYELDAARRTGLLTQPAFLAAHSHSDQTSPILRGRAVRERFFCQPLKDPPPTVVAKPPPLDPNLTTRERFAQHRTTGDACITCHSQIDDLGFALEHYDALGRYRATENDKPIDATGELLGTDVDGPMDGAIELAEKMSESRLVRDCYASQWFRYAMGRVEQTGDACSVERMKAVMERQGTIRELLMALAVSDTFVNRTETAR
jgi:hypothetical protein